MILNKSRTFALIKKNNIQYTQYEFRRRTKMERHDPRYDARNRGAIS